MSYYSKYRCCAVPECKNTSVKTPHKLWIQVPNDINMRKTWFKVGGRDPKLLSEKTRLYFCEDHFDLENDMENYIQYKIMGSVKRIRLKPHCIPSRFGWNRKLMSASNESLLAEAKRLRMSISEDSVQDYLKEDNVKASSSCIEDSQTALAVPSMENKYDKTVLDNQVQEHIATQVVLSQKHKAIQACRKAQYRRKRVQTGVKNKDEEITSPIKFFISTAISPLKTSMKNVTKPSTSQSTASRKLCIIEENCDSDTSSTPTLVGSTVDQNYSPSKASLSKTTSDTSLQAENKKLERYICKVLVGAPWTNWSMGKFTCFHCPITNWALENT